MPASTSSPTASCAATTTSTTSWRACRASRSPSSPRPSTTTTTTPTSRTPSLSTTRAPLSACVDDLRFTRTYTDRPIKFSFTGPFSLARRVNNEAYYKLRRPGAGLRDASSTAKPGPGAAGAAVLQIDEPFLAGYPEEIGLAVKAINSVYDGIDGPISRGPRLLRQPLRATGLGRSLRLPVSRPFWMRRSINSCSSLLARVTTTWSCSKTIPTRSLTLGLGVIDVKNPKPEPTELIAARVHQALQVLPADRLMINPDCGLRHLARRSARAKLRAMSTGRRPCPRGGPRANQPSQSLREMHRLAYDVSDPRPSAVQQ